MTEFERDIYKRVLEMRITECAFTKKSIPLRLLKRDVDKFWDKYINGGEL
jgi:hypothetical protein